ncbi:MAG TPA: ComF family protein [Saprospiraceae bacterium]|nr:ComF family protein [Saprospiraceae bacterium]HMQ84454.1 ComF family protein [Saprospiraceae bacterium]
MYLWWYHFTGLFYPNLCLACNKNLPPGQEILCITCQFKLPKTNFHQEKENAFTERFWGRVPLHAGAALYYFSKGGRTQQLVHALKYEGKKQVGSKLGHIYGQQLKETPLFHDVNLILPVPLHPQKERQRGYNQSALFAEGLSQSMQIPWSGKHLLRTAYTQTQTQKTRMERFANVEQAFQVPRPADLEGKHLLLVDDVMTTGATLEACALRLLEVPSVRLSMATIAIANL